MEQRKPGIDYKALVMRRLPGTARDIGNDLSLNLDATRKVLGELCDSGKVQKKWVPRVPRPEGQSSKVLMWSRVD